MLSLVIPSATSFSADFDANMKTKIASSVAKTERREEERSRVPRETCSGCYRPPTLCVCQSLPDKPIRTSTNVLILQHPNERRKPLLLFPGEDSITLDEEDDQEDGRNGVLSQLQEEDQLLILVDGTWPEAKRMCLQSPEIVDNCIKVQFQSESESIYDSLRTEPDKHCLSTLECCARALSHLEPSEDCAETANKYLLGSMQCMVDKRIELTSKNPDPRFSRPSTKIYAKNKRRYEIKKELFDN